VSAGEERWRAEGVIFVRTRRWLEVLCGRGEGKATQSERREEFVGELIYRWEKDLRGYEGKAGGGGGDGFVPGRFWKNAAKRGGGSAPGLVRWRKTY